MKKRHFLVLTAVLSLIGTGVGAELTLIHVRQISVPGFQSFCSLSQTINCDVVAQSAWAEIFGVPIASLGLFFYLFILLLVGLAGAEVLPLHIGASAIFLLTGGACIYTAFLAFISMTVIGVLCLLCSALYTVNVLMFAASWMYVRRPISEISSAWQSAVDASLMRPGRTLALLVLLFLSFVVSTGGVRMWIQAVRQKASARIEEKSVVALKPEERALFYEGKQAKGDHPSSVLTIIEFGDFECPHCRDLSQALRETLGPFGEKVRVIFKNYPLDSSCNGFMKGQIHPNACSAAVAAQCAGQQGKFWPYYDVLFKNQFALDPVSLMGYAIQTGIDVDAFKACVKDPSVLEGVKADIALGRRLGIEGVPVFIINDRMYFGARSVEELRPLIRQNLP